MSVLQAKNNYTGMGGGTRLNCAQSIANAFKEKFNLSDDFVDSFGAFGGGRAPGGLCGALYAAMTILEEVDKKKAEELMQYFYNNSGAFECSNIKAGKKLSCVGCVEKCAEYLENID